MSVNTLTLEPPRPRRRAPLGGVTASVRRGTMGLGPELATGLLYLTDDSACVRLTAPLTDGDEAELVLTQANGHRTKLVVETRWCAMLGNRNYLVKLQFRRSLPHRELAELARS
jgi:hypothetical protein